MAWVFWAVRGDNQLYLQPKKLLCYCGMVSSLLFFLFLAVPAFHCTCISMNAVCFASLHWNPITKIVRRYVGILNLNRIFLYAILYARYLLSKIAILVAQYMLSTGPLQFKESHAAIFSPRTANTLSGTICRITNE